MSIYRGSFDFDRFTMMPNTWVRDRRLDIACKGLLLYILSHNPDYPLTIEQVIAENKNGYDSISSAMKRLEEIGYLRRERQRGPDGKLGPYDWYLVDASPGAQSGKTATGRDQGKDDVSAGRDQSGESTPGFSSLANAGTKKTTNKKITTENQDACKQAAAAPSGAGHASPHSGDGESPKPDRQQKRQEHDDTEAANTLAAVEDPELDPDDIALLIAYLRLHANATSTAALTARLADEGGPTAIAEKLDAARAWNERLDNSEADDRDFFTRAWKLAEPDAARLASAFRHAYAIGAEPAASSAANAVHATAGWTVDDLYAAVAHTIQARERDRKIDRQTKAATARRRRRQEAA